MNSQRSSYWPVIVAVIAVIAAFIALPDSWKPWAPAFLKPELRLGLDLAGGTQLDFRIDESGIRARKQQISEDISRLKEEEKNDEVRSKQNELQSLEEQHANVVEAIRIVLERRMNSLGVSEVSITPSFFGDEKHLLVECPGIVDVNSCISTVGKTIRLEFKEEHTGSPDEYQAKVRAQADNVFRAVTQGTGTLQVYGQDLSSTLGISYSDSVPVFVSDLKGGMAQLASRKTTDTALRIEESVQVVVENANGQPELRSIEGINIAKVLQEPAPVTRILENPSDAIAELNNLSPADTTLEQKSAVDLASVPASLKTAIETMDIGSVKAVTLGESEGGVVYLAGRVPGIEEMTASHILIQYQGSLRADESVTRTKEEAEQKIEDIKQRLAAGGDFAEIAKNESDGPSKEESGSLGVIRRNMMVAEFDSVAFGLEQGQISSVVETPFGYHIIRADKAAAVSPSTASYTLLKTTGADPFQKAEDYASQIQNNEVSRTENQIVIRSIFFSLEPTGWKDTELNGEHFRAAGVTVDPNTNVPVVQIQFDEEGGKIFQELTKRNINKRIAIFVGGQLVSAPTVQTEISGGTAVITGSQNFEEARILAQDLNTGAIPAPIHLTGQNTIEATLGSNALRQSVYAALIGLVILGIMMAFLYRALGMIANISLAFYVILLVALIKLPLLLVSGTNVVLTLAGIAGMILSMGMAVDANILAFERIKEELRKGKALHTAIETGFNRAWPSVRDGNTSTLITCAILFIIGTSIIRGFSVTLSIGILVSLFTAMVVTRWLAHAAARSALGSRPELFGVKRSEMPGDMTR